MKKSMRVALVLASIPFLGAWSLFGTPKIEVTCAINGYGSGKCTFTNTGDGSGTECGKIIITKYNDETLESNMYCSGDVEPLTSKAIDVHISGFDELCPYDDFCTYYWKK